MKCLLLYLSADNVGSPERPRTRIHVADNITAYIRAEVVEAEDVVAALSLAAPEPDEHFLNSEPCPPAWLGSTIDFPAEDTIAGKALEKGWTVGPWNKGFFAEKGAVRVFRPTLAGIADFIDWAPGAEA